MAERLSRVTSELRPREETSTRLAGLISASMPVRERNCEPLRAELAVRPGSAQPLPIGSHPRRAEGRCSAGLSCRLAASSSARYVRRTGGPITNIECKAPLLRLSTARAPHLQFSSISSGGGPGRIGRVPRRSYREVASKSVERTGAELGGWADGGLRERQVRQGGLGRHSPPALDDGTALAACRPHASSPQAHPERDEALYVLAAEVPSLAGLHRMTATPPAASPTGRGLSGRGQSGDAAPPDRPRSPGRSPERGVESRCAAAPG